MSKTVSIEQALTFGFSSFMKNIGLLLQAFFVFAAAVAIPAVVYFYLTGFQLVTIAQQRTPADFEFIEWAILLPTAYVLYALRLGLIRIYLDIYKRGKSSLEQLFSAFSFVPRMFIAENIFNIALGIATLLFVVPGLFVLTFYGFFRFALIDRNLSVKESFVYSAKVVTGAAGRVFLFWVIVGLTATLLTAAYAFAVPILLLELFTKQLILPSLLLDAAVIVLTVVLVPSLSLSAVYMYKKLAEKTK